MAPKIILVLLLIGIGFFVWHQKQTTPKSEVVQTDIIKIISTNPEPLEEATILPSQSLTVKFNEIIDTGRLKVRFEPETPIEITTPNNDSKSDTLIINFKEPLQLGSGYTLFINPDPADKAKLLLEKDYIFHLKTIGYRGV